MRAEKSFWTSLLEGSHANIIGILNDFTVRLIRFGLPRPHLYSGVAEHSLQPSFKEKPPAPRLRTFAERATKHGAIDKNQISVTTKVVLNAPS